MKTVRRLLVRTLMATLALGLIAVATLIVEHHIFCPHPFAENDRAAEWERLGINFDGEFPLNQEPPGVASVIDPLEPAHPRARAVIDAEMPDASPEERAVWHAELKRHSPEEIREMLELHRRFSPPPDVPTPLDIQLSSSDATVPLTPLEARQAPAARASANVLAVIDSAIDAMQSAEQIMINHITDELAELRRLREQLTTLRRLQSEFSGTTP
jgi:hypothetical protein